jgi:cysteinyl-tRNA synthetase
MNDDFNSPMVIASLFEAVRIINSVNDKKETLNTADLNLLRETFSVFTGDILGLKPESGSGADNSVLDGLMQLVLDLRLNAKTAKDYATADKIRDQLSKIGIMVKDTKEGATWEMN